MLQACNQEDFNVVVYVNIMLLRLTVQLPISFPVLLCLVLDSSYGLKWHFNPPLSPWWGGIFERMVGSVERCLEKMPLRKDYL